MLTSGSFFALLHTHIICPPHTASFPLSSNVLFSVFQHADLGSGSNHKRVTCSHRTLHANAWTSLLWSFAASIPHGLPTLALAKNPAGICSSGQSKSSAKTKSSLQKGEGVGCFASVYIPDGRNAWFRLQRRGLDLARCVP